MVGTRGALAEVGEKFHGDKVNSDILHFPTPRDPNLPTQTLPKYPSFRKENDGGISQQGREFKKFQKQYWKTRAKDFK